MIKKAPIWIRLCFWLFKPRIRKLKSVPTFLFHHSPPKPYEYVQCPMESGKEAILFLSEVDTPSDPGDMHLLTWQFIKYITPNPQ